MKNYAIFSSNSSFIKENASNTQKKIQTDTVKTDPQGRKVPFFVFFSKKLFVYSDLTSYIGSNTGTLPTVDNFMTFCWENNQSGTVGIAWLGVTCSAPYGYQVNINEYYHTDSKTGQIGELY